MTRRRFGQTRKLPSGRWQARYSDPDGRLSKSGDPIRHTAPRTFDTRDDAEEWLSAERRMIADDDWTPPSVRSKSKRTFTTFAEYADTWLTGRRVKRTGQPIADRTRAEYRTMLDKHILPTFGDMPLKYITVEAVTDWYDTTLTERPTYRARAYSLLHAILASATAASGPIPGRLNPAAVEGGSTTMRATRTTPATLDELAVIIENLPAEHQAMVLLAGWCAMRYGEITALCRADLDLDREVIRISRSIIWLKGESRIKSTKSGRPRVVAIPPHIVEMLQDHLDKHVAPDPDALLFQGRDGGHLRPSSFYGKVEKQDKAGKVTQRGWGWYRARQIANRDDLRFHDLRHTAGTMAAQTGATLGELMERLGHSTVNAAIIYQHAALGRDAKIAAALSEMANR